MKRSIPTYALLLASVSTVLGSGWLFASYYTSILAGPAALLAWLIGGASVVLVAFVFAELCALLPITGSSTRIPQFTHGTLVSFVFSWLIWLSYAAMVPAEVQAVLQYLSYFYPTLVHANGGLTESGYLLATVLMFSISALNIFSLRWLLRCNNILTLLKLFIPLVVSLVIIAYFVIPSRPITPITSHFMPLGFQGVLAALTTGGILFAFSGFKQACEMAGEAKNPNRALPIAVIGSVVVCLLIYLLLQVAFLFSLDDRNLSQGWLHLQVSGGNSPLAAILNQDKLSLLLPLLYVGAIIGPLAAALMYASSSSRSLYGMSKNNHIPFLFQKVTSQGNPILAVVVNFVLGMSMFAPLPGWDRMIAFLTSLMSITYSIGPVCLLALRSQLPEENRPFRLPFVTVWATLAFYVCTVLAYCSGWDNMSKLTVTLLIGLAVLLIHQLFIQREQRIQFHWRCAFWMWPYFTGLMLMSYLGTFGNGLGVIPFGWDFAILGGFCVVIMSLAMKFKLPASETYAYIRGLGMTPESLDSDLAKESVES